MDTIYNNHRNAGSGSAHLASGFIISVRLLLLVCLMISSEKTGAQELGYLSGVTKQGVNPHRFEPLYGFTIGYGVNKFLSVETALYYSQRSYGSVIQADYFSFLAMPKLGYFGKKAGVYYSPGIALNPTLHHSNAINHTYVSTIQSIGGQVLLIPYVLLDLKLGYDYGLTYGHFDNNIYTKYSGPIVFLGLKYTQNLK